MTSLGSGMRAVAETPVVAQLQGVNVARITMITFFVSALLPESPGYLLGCVLERLVRLSVLQWG